MSKLRTFIAVEAPAKMQSRATALISQLSTTPARVKWVEEHNLHWTVKFLGDVNSNDIPQICDAVGVAVRTCRPFEIGACGAGAFPEAARPRTIWLGVGDGTQQFIELHDAVQEALAELGFRKEHRRFTPHLTLGRVRRSPDGIRELGELVIDHADFDAGRMTVSQLVIYSSQLERNGPVYQALGRIPIGS